MPSPVITFENVFDVMHDKKLSRQGKDDESYLLAEGLVDGKVVATHKVCPARRPSKLLLWADDEKVQMRANGSDMVTVVAAVADENGNIKRLNNGEVRFEIEGPGALVADVETFTNPCPVRWGTAPVLVKAGITPGEIRVRASVLWQGKHTPVSAELVIRSFPADYPLVANEDDLKKSEDSGCRSERQEKGTASDYEKRIRELQQEVSRLKLREVERQQEDFE